MSDRNRYAAEWADTPDEAAWFYTALDRHDDLLADQRTDAAHETTGTSPSCGCHGPCHPYCWGHAFRTAYDTYFKLGGAA